MKQSKEIPILISLYHKMHGCYTCNLVSENVAKYYFNWSRWVNLFPNYGYTCVIITTMNI